MKATVDRLTLKDALKIAGTTNGRRATLPALSHVKITAEAGQLKLEATDLETWTSVDIDAETHDDGTAHVDLKALSGAVRNGNDTATLSLEGDTLTVDTGAVVTLPTLAEPDDFPAAPNLEPSESTEWTPADVEVLRRVALAASNDEARPVLTGVRMHNGAAASTDSYRLHVGSLSTAWIKDALVPARTVARTVCKYADEPATIGAGTLDGPAGRNRAVRFAYTAVRGPKRARRRLYVEATVRQIDGSFPNWPDLIPKSEDVEARQEVDGPTLADALAQLKPHAKAGRGEAPVVIEPQPEPGPFGGWRLSVTRDESTAEATVPLAMHATGEPHRIALNVRYLADCVEAATFGDGRIVVETRDGLKPAVIGPANPNGATDLKPGQVFALLMPVRTE